MTRLREWGSALSLGAWLSIASVWLVTAVPGGRTPLLWQPMLVVSMLVLTAVQARQVGWVAAAARSFYLAVVMTLAGWLPWLRTILPTPEFQYPYAYRYYLALYEGLLSACLGCQAFWAVADKAVPAWWPSGRWSRPLIVAPVLLMIRAVLFGHWISPLVGVFVGIGVAAWRSWAPSRTGRSEIFWKLVPWLLVLFTGCLVFASGMRIYHQLGANFPLDSDDGTSYFGGATEIARDPRRIWTKPPIETNMFSLYVVLMGLWFRLAGSHIPSWLVWQGLAAGLLAVMVFQLARQGRYGRLVGLVAAVLVALDHVMVHLMATLNMEVAFIPTLYVATWLWISVPDQPPRAQVWRCLWAGFAVGMATLFRPTAGLLPLVLWVALLWERPRLSWRSVGKQIGWMCAGFSVPIALLLIRHRLAWGHWTLGDSSGAPLSWNANYAWAIHGQHPYRIGWGPWLKLLAADPSVIWHKMIPDWWTQFLYLWTHRGFGQMDLIQGLNYPGLYQAALAAIFTVCVVVGMAKAVRHRTRADLVLLVLPAYFTGLTFVFWVINTRYRAPFIPALYLLCCAGFSAISAAVRVRSPIVASAPAVARVLGQPCAS